jgi:hypothetical protein
MILSPAVAGAETIIIEYPDHFYAESTGTPEAGAPPSHEKIAPTAVAKPAPADQDRGTHAPASRPVTNFEAAPEPVDPVVRRAGMQQEIDRLQRARGDLLAPRDGETPDDAAHRQQRAAGMLRKINKMSSELLNME